MNRKHNRISLLAGLFGLAGILLSCSDGPTAEEQALLAAKGYYEHLAAGEYDRFLEGKADVDSLPADYRQQLLAACKQLVARQRDEHGGISEVKAGTAAVDTLLDITQAFLIITYADSTAEEIVVPMVERSGSWRMK